MRIISAVANLCASFLLIQGVAPAAPAVAELFKAQAKQNPKRAVSIKGVPLMTPQKATHVPVQLLDRGLKI